MDFGDGVYFLEETSLALAPAFPEAELKQRLEKRLANAGNAITEVMDEEHCLFPMNLPSAGFPSAGVGLWRRGEHGASGFGLHGGSAVKTRARFGRSLGRGFKRATSNGICSAGARGLAGAVADGVGATPSPVSVWFRPFDALR